MKRINLSVLAVAAALGLSGCGSTNHLRKHLPTLNGEPAEVATQVFGPRFQLLDTPTGKQYVWRLGRNDERMVIGPSVLIMANHGRVYCTLTVDIDASGRIARSSFAGDDDTCAMFDAFLRKNLQPKG